MSSHGDMFDEETPVMGSLHLHESPESHIPLTDPLLQNTLMIETETTYDEYTRLIPVSAISETNLLMSDQQSTLISYQETSTLSQNSLEMQQYQHQVRQQQLGNSYETWFQENLLNEQCFLRQSILNSFQESSVFTMNQLETGQQVELENNGFAYSTIYNPHESPNHLQEQPPPPLPVLQEEHSNGYWPLLSQLLGCFPTYNLPVTTTTSVPMQLPAHTLSNSQYRNSYDLTSLMVPNPEPSSLIVPNNLVPNGSQNYLPNQSYRHVPFNSSSNMHGLPPSVLWTYPQPNQSSMIPTPNEALQHNILLPDQTTTIPTPNNVIQHNIPQPNQITMIPTPSNVLQRDIPQPNQITMIPTPNSVLHRNIPHPNQITMIPTPNNVLQRNMSFIPSPQISLNSTRHYGGNQVSVHQPSPRVMFSTPTRIGPNANSIIPPQTSGLGSWRRSYQSEFDVGQSSSPAQRRRITPGNENFGSTAEERVENKIYNPIYESLGLLIDPHLSEFSQTQFGRLRR